MGPKGAKRAKKDTKPEELATLLVERFPLELRREVRSVAARQGRTARDVWVEAGRMWLAKQEGKK